MSEVESGRPEGVVAAAISRLLVATTAEFTGRGPTKAKTSFGSDVITIVLEDTLTKAERGLVRDGFAGEVVAMRRAFQCTMAPTLIEGIEKITGRSVAAFLSDSHIDPDIAVETFVLTPPGTKAPAPGTPDRRGPTR